MANLQDIFNRMQENKQEQKEIKNVYKDALSNNEHHTRIKNEIKDLREQKKTIEHSIQAEMGKDYAKLEDLKYDLQTDQELINDLALNKLAKKETIEITDIHDNEYEPIFTIKFKKIYNN